jgi:hypothetical protein
VSIAGVESTDPLWSRPFRRAPAGALPSRRRDRRVRLLLASTAFVTLVATAAGIGYAAAPKPELAQIRDPAGRAQADFASVLSQFPLSNDSVNAAVVAAATSGETGSHSVTRPDPAGGEPVRGEEAMRLLRQAVQAAGEVPHRGRQVVVARQAGRTLSGHVAVTSQPGQGSQVSLLSTTGTPIASRFVSRPAPSRMVDRELLALLERNFTLQGAAGTTVAGRSAVMVEATPSRSPGSVVARWWLDRETGLVLWSETYEPAGALVLASGFAAVEVGNSSAAFLEHLAPDLASPVTSARLTLSSTRYLNDHGWTCSDSLAGLSLVRLRATTPDGAGAGPPAAVHLVYSDGISTVSVREERGRLERPKDAAWDAALAAYVKVGASSSAVWASGETVFTVVTDGPASLLADAVTALPHEPTLVPTTMERIRAGWVRTVERIVG